MKEFGRKAVNMDVWQKLVKLSPNGRLLWKFHLIYKEGGLRGHFVAGFFVFFSIRLLFFHHNCYPSLQSLPPGQQWKRRYEWKSIFGALISLLWLFLWCPIDSLYNWTFNQRQNTSNFNGKLWTNWSDKCDQIKFYCNFVCLTKAYLLFKLRRNLQLWVR